MKPIALSTILLLAPFASLAQGRPFPLPTRPGPAAQAPTLDRDPGTGNYRLSYTADDGQAYTMTIESMDRVVFGLGLNISVDSSFSAITYSYRLQNTAAPGEGTRVRALILPCADPSARTISRQWRGRVSVVELISARKCVFTGSQRTQLASGAALTDAAIESNWLPGIDNAMVSGEATPPVWPSGEMTPKAALMLADTVNSTFLGGRTAETVAPVKAPSVFAGSGRGLSIVLEDLSQACALGWVKTPGICNSFEVKLKHALDALLQNDLGLARGQLVAFQNELSAQHGKQVNELAFALLNTNVGYILSHL
jgi:hypothetical protein